MLKKLTAHLFDDNEVLINAILVQMNVLMQLKAVTYQYT